MVVSIVWSHLSRRCTTNDQYIDMKNEMELKTCGDVHKFKDVLLFSYEFLGFDNIE